MSAATTFTWIGSLEAPARRPSLDDIGGDSLEERAPYPPKDGTKPYADQLNERARQIRGAAATIPAAVVYVRFNAGAPIVDDVITVDSNLTTSDFDVIDNGAGDTTIEWRTYLLPPMSVRPLLTLSDDVEIDRFRVFTDTPSGADMTAIRVVTKLITVATDCAFTVAIF